MLKNWHVFGLLFIFFLFVDLLILIICICCIERRKRNQHKGYVEAATQENIDDNNNQNSGKVNGLNDKIIGLTKVSFSFRNEDKLDHLNDKKQKDVQFDVSTIEKSTQNQVSVEYLRPNFHDNDEALNGSDFKVLIPSNEVDLAIENIKMTYRNSTCNEMMDSIGISNGDVEKDANHNNGIEYTNFTSHLEFIELGQSKGINSATHAVPTLRNVDSINNSMVEREQFGIQATSTDALTWSDSKSGLKDEKFDLKTIGWCELKRNKSIDINTDCEMHTSDNAVQTENSLSWYVEKYSEINTERDNHLDPNNNLPITNDIKAKENPTWKIETYSEIKTKMYNRLANDNSLKDGITGQEECILRLPNSREQSPLGSSGGKPKHKKQKIKTEITKEEPSVEELMEPPSTSLGESMDPPSTAIGEFMEPPSSSEFDKESTDQEYAKQHVLDKFREGYIEYNKEGTINVKLQGSMKTEILEPIVGEYDKELEELRRSTEEQKSKFSDEFIDCNDFDAVIKQEVPEASEEWNGNTLADNILDDDDAIKMHEQILASLEQMQQQSTIGMNNSFKLNEQALDNQLGEDENEENRLTTDNQEAKKPSDENIYSMKESPDENFPLNKRAII